MDMTLCYICGWDFKEIYSGGDICPCCGSEYDFDDCLEKEEILEKYSGGLVKADEAEAAEREDSAEKKLIFGKTVHFRNRFFLGCETHQLRCDIPSPLVATYQRRN